MREQPDRNNQIRAADGTGWQRRRSHKETIANGQPHAETGTPSQGLFCL